MGFMKKSLKKLVFVLAGLMCFSCPVFCQEPKAADATGDTIDSTMAEAKDPLSLTSIIFSFGATADSMIIKNKEGTKKSRMQTDFQPSISLGLSSGVTKFKDSNFGYMYSLVIGSYNIDRTWVDKTKFEGEDPTIDGEDRMPDLGTSIDGYTISATPILMYEYSYSPITFFFAGIGLGLGFMTFNGSAYYLDGDVSEDCRNGTSAREFELHCEKINVGGIGFGVSGGVLFGMRYGNWDFKWEQSGPQISKSDYTVTMTRAVIHVSYRYQF